MDTVQNLDKGRIIFYDIAKAIYRLIIPLLQIVTLCVCLLKLLLHFKAILFTNAKENQFADNPLDYERFYYF